MVSSVNKALFLVFLVGLVAKTSCTLPPPPATNRVLCALLPNLRLCLPILRAGVLIGFPPVGCCTDLRILQLAANLAGRTATCQCVRRTLSIELGDIIPPVNPRPSPRPGIGFDVSAQIQAACGVNLGFRLDAHSPCYV